MKRNNDSGRAEKRPAALFILVQAMGVCAMVIVAVPMAMYALELLGVLTAVPNYLLMDSLEILDVPVWLLLLQEFATAGLGVCLLWLLLEFVRMCGRVRKETAFTPANVRAVGRIALAFTIGGALLLLVGMPLMDWLLTGMRAVESPVWGLLPPFAAWAAALMVRAIQVLLRRAVDMQTEQDLTV